MVDMTPSAIRAGLIDYRRSQIEKLMSLAAWDDLPSIVRIDIEEAVDLVEKANLDDDEAIARVVTVLDAIQDDLAEWGVELPDVH